MVAKVGKGGSDFHPNYDEHKVVHIPSQVGLGSGWQWESNVRIHIIYIYILCIYFMSDFYGSETLHVVC